MPARLIGSPAIMRAVKAATSAVLSCAVLASCAAMPGAAAAATVEIGAVAEISSNTPPDPISATTIDAPQWTVQWREASGRYAVPAGYGVITAWRHRTGGAGGGVTFKVYRPTSDPRRFLAVAANARTVTSGTNHSFLVRIPVEPGDRIGISTTAVEVAYRTFNSADQMGLFPFLEPDPAVGTTARIDDPFLGYKVDVAARVETDADGDGFGDVSQDACPTSAATYGGPCPGTAPPAFAGCPARSRNLIFGTGAANSITGTPGGDRIFAGAGNDTVDAVAGDDCIELGSGADRGQGGSGADLMLGGPDNDRMSGSSGDDRLRGGPGADRVLGAFGDDVLSGEAAGDRLSGSRGRDRISGGAGNDAISAGSSDDRVSGGSGRDRINGNSGRDRITAGSGNDRVDVRDGQRDRVACGRGRDRVRTDRRDRVARDCERVRRARPGSDR